MNRNSALLVSLFLFVALSMVYAELVPWRQCPYPDPDTQSNCTIDEVYIDPCKESAEGKPCKLKRGVVGNMTFHYTPSFSSEKIQGRIFWASQVMDIPFLGMSPDACLSTSCPIEAGQKNTYHVEVPILKKYPVRTYDLKWKIWNEEEQECCFMFQIKITK
ncbi:MD-2-related lipid-recognition protein-like [Bombus pascuorum]|uniref:MD-2-related lipid-recognition protein-like n=1 Tax=Bombus pascuorum TaxID=65598 RepID=UPI0021279714|nr:MD-2-related lipid-recognition protein-like [Bombus pascuorum]